MRLRKTVGALALAMLLIVPAGAAAKSPATTKNKERKQNKRISTATTQARDAAQAIPVLAAQLGTVNNSVVAIVGDLGSPKDLVNRVNFLIAAAGALATDVNSLKTTTSAQQTALNFLSKETILATQLEVNGTRENDCFGESPLLPPSKNGQTLSMTCLVTNSGPVTLPGSCRSSKTNGGTCLEARVLAYEQEGSAPVKGTTQTLTQRNALVDNADPGGFSRSLKSSDQNPTNLLSGASPPDSTGSSVKPAVVHITILAFDPNPDTSSNPPQET